MQPRGRLLRAGGLLEKFCCVRLAGIPQSEDADQCLSRQAASRLGFFRRECCDFSLCKMIVCIATLELANSDFLM
jgi:hypothetical protein